MADNGEQQQDDYVKIKVVGDEDLRYHEGNLHFRLKATTEMSKLKKAYAGAVGVVAVRTLRYMFNGRRIKDDDTVASLDMLEDDVIEVYLEEMEMSSEFPTPLDNMTRMLAELQITPTPSLEEGLDTARLNADGRTCFFLLSEVMRRGRRLQNHNIQSYIENLINGHMSKLEFVLLLASQQQLPFHLTTMEFWQLLLAGMDNLRLAMQSAQHP